MKTYRSAWLALSLTCLHAAPFAQAAAGREAKLKSFNLDPQIEAEVGRPRSGQIVLNEIHRSLDLTLDRARPCSPGKLCIALEAPPYRTSVPILDETRDDCGSMTYSGSHELTATDDDGHATEILRETLVLTDNSTRTCRDLRPATEVTYRTEILNSAGEVQSQTHSQMVGERLQIAD